MKKDEGFGLGTQKIVAMQHAVEKVRCVLGLDFY
jgi:hypothetical protein